MTTQTNSAATTTATGSGALIYRFEAKLADMYPVGIFPEGVRFYNEFAGTVVDGPFAGAKLVGLDPFLLRPDGIGEIDAPEVIDAGDVRVSLHVRGYVVPPEGMEMPPLEVIVSPDFAFPDIDFRVTGAATIKCAAPGYSWLNRTIAVIEGTANLSTGQLIIEARVA